jgi:hypothetical protein
LLYGTKAMGFYNKIANISTAKIFQAFISLLASRFVSSCELQYSALMH